MANTTSFDRAGHGRGWFRVERAPRLLRLVLGGQWTVQEAPRLDSELRALEPGDASEAEIDGSSVERLDSAGAWLLVRTKRLLQERGQHVSAIILPEIYGPLVHT